VCDYHSGNSSRAGSKFRFVRFPLVCRGTLPSNASAFARLRKAGAIVRGGKRRQRTIRADVSKDEPSEFLLCLEVGGRPNFAPKGVRSVGLANQGVEVASSTLRRILKLRERAISGGLQRSVRSQGKTVVLVADTTQDAPRHFLRRVECRVLVQLKHRSSKAAELNKVGPDEMAIRCAHDELFDRLVSRVDLRNSTFKGCREVRTSYTREDGVTVRPDGRKTYGGLWYNSSSDRESSDEEPPKNKPKVQPTVQLGLPQRQCRGTGYLVGLCPRETETGSDLCSRCRGLFDSGAWLRVPITPGLINRQPLPVAPSRPTCRERNRTTGVVCGDPVFQDNLCRAHYAVANRGPQPTIFDRSARGPSRQRGRNVGRFRGRR